MKKDIEIPKVEGIFIAAIREKNQEFRSMEWNIYLINETNTPIETVIVVCRGYDDKRKTATTRHSLKLLPQQSFAKVEYLQDELTGLKNEFSVSFFRGDELFHKNFTFPEGSINEQALREIPLLDKEGILIR